VTDAHDPAASPQPAPPTPPAAPMFTALDHIGIAVPDLDAAIAFYEAAFGLHVAHRETNPEQGVEEAMLGIGEDAERSHVQLLAPLSADSPIGKFLADRGPGIQQMAYRVPDLDAACARLRAAGVRLLYDDPRVGTAGSRVNFVHPKSTGGVLVELVEPAADGPLTHR